MMLQLPRSLFLWSLLASCILCDNNEPEPEDLPPQTSCPASFNLQKFNDTQPSQTATFLDIDFTCIYNDLSRDQFSYSFVPAPFIRVEPGENISFYSTPADIYDIVDRDNGATISLAHNPVTTEPGMTSLVITWPATQLQKVRMGTVNGTLLLAEGFTNLQEINVTGRLGGLEAIISTKGTARMRLIGENLVGKRIMVEDQTSLNVYIENGVGDVEIQGPPGSISGEVHAVRITSRTGSVSLEGVASIQSTGQGPGQLYADDCNNVNGNCNPLGNTTLTTPDPSCRLTDTCLVTVFTTSMPVRTCTGQVPEVGTECQGDSAGGGSGGAGIGRLSSSFLFVLPFAMWATASLVV